jgi:hypothetical protein
VHTNRKEAAIDVDKILPANQQPTEVAQPREAALHRIPLPVVVLTRDDRASPLGLLVVQVSLRWDAHLDAAASERLAKPTTIIPTIRHQRGRLRASIARVYTDAPRQHNHWAAHVDVVID